MQLTKLFNLTFLAAALTIAVAGCQTGPQRPVRIPGSNPNIGTEGLNGGKPLPPISPGDFGTQPPTPGEPHPPTEPGNHQNWPEDPATLKPQTVYFDLDKSTFKSSEQSKLNAVVNFLKSNPDKAVRVEGNCDERGTEEYNRSLGERRALAAREFLINSGVDPQRVDTLTNGEDKPAETGHNEAAWSKNRRDDFIVLTPPKP